jgi:hypothetical protein
VQDERDINTVERTIEKKRFNASPLLDWTAGGLGAVSLAFGVPMIASPSTFASNGSPATATAPASSGVSSGAITGLGIGLVVLGGALLTAPLVDAIHASGSEKSVATDRVSGPVLRQDPCPSAPLANAQVIGRPLHGDADSSHDLALGTTDANGHARVDLDSAIDADWVVPKDATLQVDVSWQVAQAVAPDSPTKVSPERTRITAGNVDLEPLYMLREARAWARAEPDRCRAAKESGDCDPLARFASAYSTGPHGAEAKATVTASRAAIQRRLQAQQVRQKAEAQSRQAKAACEASCRNECTIQKFREFGDCFAGCVQSKCSGG